MVSREDAASAHGAVERQRKESSDEDSYVITEDHYFDFPFYNEIPVNLREEFQKRGRTRIIGAPHRTHRGQGGRYV